MAKIDELRVEITATDNASPVLQRVSTNVSTLSQNIQRAGRNFQTFAQNLRQQLQTFDKLNTRILKYSTILVSTLTGAASASAFFGARVENAFQKAYTMFDVSQKQFEQMKRSIVDLSKISGYSLEQLADALYLVGSASVPAEKAVSVLRKTSVAAIAGATDLATSFQSAISIINAYGLSLDKLSQVYAMQFEAVKKGLLTYEELARTFGVVAPAASQLGVSLREALAGFVALTRVGFDAAEASTATASAFEDLMEKTTNLQELGISLYDEFGKFRGLERILEDLAKAFEGLTDEEKAAKLEAIGFEIRAARAIVSWINNLDILKDTLKSIRGDTAALISAFQKQTNNVHFLLKLMRSELEALNFQFFTVMRPVIVEVLQKIIAFLRGITEYIKRNPELVRKFFVELVKVSAIVLGISAAFKVITSVLQLFVNLLTSAKMLLNPFILGLVGMFAVLTVKFGSFKKALADVWDWVKNIGKAFWNWIKGWFSGVNLIQKGFAEIKNLAQGILYIVLKVLGFIPGIGKMISPLAEAVKPQAEGTFVGVIKAFFSKAEGWILLIIGLLTMLPQLLGTIFGTVIGRSLTQTPFSNVGKWWNMDCIPVCTDVGAGNLLKQYLPLLAPIGVGIASMVSLLRAISQKKEQVVVETSVLPPSVSVSAPVRVDTQDLSMKLDALNEQMNRLRQSVDTLKENNLPAIEHQIEILKDSIEKVKEQIFTSVQELDNSVKGLQKSFEQNLTFDVSPLTGKLDELKESFKESIEHVYQRIPSIEDLRKIIPLPSVSRPTATPPTGLAGTLPTIDELIAMQIEEALKTGKFTPKAPPLPGKARETLPQPVPQPEGREEKPKEKEEEKKEKKPVPGWEWKAPWILTPEDWERLRRSLKETRETIQRIVTLTEKDLQKSKKELFIEQYMPLFMKYGYRFNIRPEILATISALETGWGIHFAGRYNLFGMMQAKTGEYRQYESFEESIKDFIETIKNLFPEAWKYRQEPAKFFEALMRGIYGAYSENKEYPKLLQNVYESLKPVIQKRVQETTFELVDTMFEITEDAISTALENTPEGTTAWTELNKSLQGLWKMFNALIWAFRYFFTPTMLPLPPLPVWQEGGYTGSGRANEIAGVVHKGEYVVPKWMVERYPELIANLEVLRRGYQEGGLVGKSPSVVKGSEMQQLLDIGKDILDELGLSVESIGSLIELMKHIKESLPQFLEEFTKDPLKATQDLIAEIGNQSIKEFQNTQKIIQESQRKDLLKKAWEGLKEQFPQVQIYEAIPKFFEGFSNALKIQETSLGEFFSEFAETIRKPFEGLKEEFGVFIEGIKQKFAGDEGVFGALFKGFESAFGFLKDLLKGSLLMDLAQGLLSLISASKPLMMVLQPLSTIFQGMAEVLAPVLDEVFRPLADLLIAIGRILGALLIPVVKALAPLIQMFVNLFIVAYKVGRPILMFFYEMLRSIANFFIGIYNFVANAINTLLGWLGIHLPTLQYLNVSAEQVFPEELNLGGQATGATGGTYAGSVGASTAEVYYITINNYISNNLADSEALKEAILSALEEIGIDTGGVLVR